MINNNDYCLFKIQFFFFTEKKYSALKLRSWNLKHINNKYYSYFLMDSKYFSIIKNLLYLHRTLKIYKTCQVIDIFFTYNFILFKNFKLFGFRLFLLPTLAFYLI